MKHKEKRLKYARQYQTMSAKEWSKVVFSDEEKFNLDGSEVLAHKKSFQKRITQPCIVEEDLSWSERPSHIQENLNYNLSVVVKKQHIMWKC